MPRVTLVEGINLALARALADDPDVVVIGEDVGLNGGVFRATVGLQQRFGKLRVQDTPLAEGLIAGMSIGMASQGLKVVAEIQFMGFLYPALDQIANHMARLRNRTRGRLTCPVVIRMPHGGGIHAPEHHSESLEVLLCHHAGLRVVCPGTPAAAYGLLLAAIREPDPVLFLEPTRLYRLAKQDILDDGVALPLDRAQLLQQGDDVTLVSWGAMLHETRQAAERLAQEKIGCELIDLTSLSPIDWDCILESVAHTGRLVIVHEAARTAGLGAEIAATVAERALHDLLAPVQRVTGYDTVMPYFAMERTYIPGVARIVEAVRNSMKG
ncbi:MAG TPA: alpha-ketoacid dehydrogenase subunit beta [Steroidobacteraceae bacterium]|nr:alpha-ketoacid dehydrogenase subunit beta [Steroidobacteraceae bacterium]